jgi:hypothetical protein
MCRLPAVEYLQLVPFNLSLQTLLLPVQMVDPGQPRKLNL